MVHPSIFKTFIILVILATQNSISLATKGTDYTRDACRVTRYPSLCVHSLSPFSGSAKRSPHRWARAALSVTLGEAEAIGRYVKRFNRTANLKRRVRFALSDCVECFQDTVDQLHSSLGELRRLNRKSFASQVGNVQTWVSAALTYEDTCLDGLRGCKGARVRALKGKVDNMMKFTSNALALVNRLASAGEWSLRSTRNPWKIVSLININGNVYVLAFGRTIE